MPLIVLHSLHKLISQANLILPAVAEALCEANFKLRQYSGVRVAYSLPLCDQVSNIRST